MGKILTTKIDRFDGGMANDVRSKESNKARLIKHFDALSFPHRLVPHRESETGNDTIARKIDTFCYVNSLGLVGLGTSASKATVFYKNVYTDGVWETTANNASVVADKASNGFAIYYPATGLVYVTTGTSNVEAYDPTGTNPFVTQSVGLWSSGGRACLHSKDDTLYVSYQHSTLGARIAKYDGSTWTIPALTLGLRYTITAMCEYGNYLAIACKTSDSFGDRSKVFLWDRDSSLTTLSESIDWGYGKLEFLESYEGALIGVSYQDSAVFQSNRLGPERLSIKAYTGNVPTEILNLISDTTAYPAALLGQLYGTGFQKTNNRLYFLAGIQIDGTVLNGLWSIGKVANQPYALQLEYLPNNDTTVTSMEGFYVAGSFAFIAYNNDGSLSKTIETLSYSATSTWESLKYDLGEVSLKKKLLGVSVNTVPLPTAGQVVLKYKADSDTSWTTIFTHTTDNSVSHSSVNIESTGANLPEFNEIQFQIESTGGAEITGLTFDCEVMGKRPY